MWFSYLKKTIVFFGDIGRSGMNGAIVVDKQSNKLVGMFIRDREKFNEMISAENPTVDATKMKSSVSAMSSNLQTFYQLFKHDVDNVERSVDISSKDILTKVVIES